MPVTERRFADVTHLLRGRERAGQEDLASRFEVWTNARGWLFNNPRDPWTPANGIFGFDMTKVLDDDDIRTAALGYIFHRIEGMMDGTPMMLFIDEGWKILNDDKFSGFVNDKLKTIRKLNGIVGFGTQSAKDIVASPMGHTLLEQTPTNIFFPNPKADDRAYRRRVQAFASASSSGFANTHPELASVPHQARSGFGDRAARSLRHARPREGAVGHFRAGRGNGEPDRAAWP